MRKINLSDLNITSYEDHLDASIHHFSAFDHVSGQIGHGSDPENSLAFKKAVNELVERIHFHQIAKAGGSRTSSGFAAHDDSTSASESAINECVERDVFLMTWIARHPPCWLKQNSGEPNLDIFLNNTNEVFNKNGFTISFGVTGRSNGRTAVVGILRPHPHGPYRFGVVFSAAASPSLLSGLNSIYLELRRAANMVINRSAQRNMIYESIESSMVSTTKDHLEYYLNPDNCKNLNWYFTDTDMTIEFPDIQYECIEISLNVIPPWPMKLAYASSLNAQSFFVGPTHDFNINKNRIFSSFEPDTKLNFGLHPLP